MRELRRNGTEVIWHRKMTWRQRGGCDGREKHNYIDGGDMERETHGRR
jgi:hypothetical protein